MTLDSTWRQRLARPLPSVQSTRCRHLGLALPVPDPLACPLCRPTAAAVFLRTELVLGWSCEGGCCLLVPRRHVASWFDADEAERRALLDAVDAARFRLEHDLHPAGYHIDIGDDGCGHLALRLTPQFAPAGDDDPYPAATAASRVGEALPLADPEPVAPPLAHGLVAGGIDDPLLPHLVAQLDRADEADIAVAFVMASGLAAIDAALDSFFGRSGRMRLVAGDYLDATDPDALDALLDRSEALVAEERGARLELWVHECHGGATFHPKAYVFRMEPRYLRPAEAAAPGLAFVGSSNLSRPALAHGIEWSYPVRRVADPRGFASIESAFAALLRHPATRRLDRAWVKAYRARRRVPQRLEPAPPPAPPPPPPCPDALQSEALAALEASQAAGHRAGLVVMATGLGKTLVAAFFWAALGRPRCLFVAHRVEILRQAQAAFRLVDPAADLGLYAADTRDDGAGVLMASVQTLGRARHLERMAPAAFQLIVVDEFHHASAATYRRLIDHFEPDFLLGLTATPERSDGGDLLGLCGENLVYRCDLLRGIAENGERLVPFSYFGVPDDIDYANIPWRNSRFDPDELTRHAATLGRADNALAQWQAHAGTRTVGFCCSTVHADFMRDHFRAAEVRAASIHSGPSSDPRAASLERLERGELAIVFAVDILNEGVDLPAVDTVLMLRPTESKIVWLQQLGRGLRRSPGKGRLTVVDYIGNHRSFLTKVQALFALDPGEAQLRRVLDLVAAGRQDELGLPPGCEISYQLEAVDILRALLRPVAGADQLRAFYAAFVADHGRRPLAAEAFHEGVNPRAAKAHFGSWLRCVAAMGGLDPGQAAVLSDGPASAFLAELEGTAMARSFKMVTLLALLRHDQLPGALALADLATTFASLARRHPSLSADVSCDLADHAAVKRYLLVNPVAAWCRPQHGRLHFELADDVLATTFALAPELRASFQDLARELVEWRLADYLARGGRDTPPAGEVRVVGKVIQSSGRPILKLPARPTPDPIPHGEVAVEVEGAAWTARFAKLYVNVMTEPADSGNALAALMQRWFGPAAGQPGTMHFVAFSRAGEGWSLTPLAPGEAARPAVEVGRASSGRMQVVADDGRTLDEVAPEVARGSDGG